MTSTTDKHFCILPWVHLHVSQNGRVSPCCNNNSYLGNVQEKSIKEIWSGKKFEAIRDQFANNIPDKRCNHCYNIEKSGKESLRQISNKNYSKELTRVSKKNPQPIYLDIRFSNICNFKCKTCWHGNSSAWFEENSNRNASKNRVIKAFTHDFNELLSYIDNVEEIYFAGGEPLMMEEHYLILEELEKRNLFNVKIRYNTNFSILNFKDRSILEIWKRFNKVHVSASIDAAFNLGEEIREGFNWEKFMSNRRLMQLVCPDIYFEITPTISSLNIFNLPELHQYLVINELIPINNIYLNFLERPSEFNIKSLPQHEKINVKNLIIKHMEWLETNDANSTIKNEFKHILTYL